MHQKKWEYKNSQVTSSRRVARITEVMNEEAAEGWELIGLPQHAEDEFQRKVIFFYWKRPV
tara:strand:- start:144 stop:326 length:183 start_codon:yes stop_codon:yes gene_type:complete